MNQELFSLDKAKKLFFDNLYNKDLVPCQNYIKSYFFPMDNGGHCMWDAKNQRFTNLTKDQVRDVYFNRLPKEIKSWYFSDYTSIFSPINSVHKPFVNGNELNMCQGFLHKTKKPYAPFPLQTRLKVDLYLNYIKEVLVGGCEKSYEYLLKIFSNMCKGIKNRSLLYFKGPEGLGKSINIEMMINFVLGKAVCVKANIDTITSSFNKILCGKVFVVYEEMPVFSRSQWEFVSGKLKDMVTGDSLIYSDKYEKAFEAENINNYIINTNVEAIKGSNGRRYFIADCSSHRFQDFAYFANISDTCLNLEVGEAYWNYLLEIDTTKFHSEMHMPVTEGKLNAIADKLELPFQFIKDQYVLKRNGINCKNQDFYNLYCDYVSSKHHKPLSKIFFSAKLKEQGIKFKKSDKSNIWKYSYAELQAIADKFKWIHALDEYEGEVKVTNKEKPIIKDEPKAIIKAQSKEDLEKLRERLEIISCDEYDYVMESIKDIQREPEDMEGIDEGESFELSDSEREEEGEVVENEVVEEEEAEDPDALTIQDLFNQ